MIKKLCRCLSCWLGLVFISLTVVGCGGSNAPTSSVNELRVAMILPGPIDDNNWNTAGYQGLQLIEQDLGVLVDYLASVPVSEAEAALREYATDNYDFIIAHGGQFLSAIEIVAKEFPRLKFAIVTPYEGNNRNLGAITFRDYEIGYLGGVVAGLKTKTNKVAYVGGEQQTNTLEKASTFEQGAKSVNPAVEVSTEWVGSWDDTEKAREIAQALVDSQVDVLASDADAAGLPVHQVAQQAGVYSIGWIIDQHDVAPDTVLTSCVQRTPLMLLEAAKLVQLGRWEGKLYKFGLKDKVQELAPFHGLLTPEEEEQVNQTKADIISGEIHIIH